MAASHVAIGEGGLTQRLAAFAAGAHHLAIAEPALEAAQRAVIDTIGVLLAGRVEPPIALIGTTLDNGGDVLSLALGRRMRAGDAALADGMAGHMLDFDDVAQHGHPSVVIVPALLAEAQRLRASGLSLLRASVVGYETWAELARRESDSYHLGAWHPTPMLGTIAATAALCTLGGFDAATARHALALAASSASGVIANFGTDAKPLHAGRAAASALEAARLARAGITGAADALEGAHGLLRGMSPRGRVDTQSPPSAAAGEWHLLEHGLSVKRYPVCYASHRAIDATLALVAEADLQPGDVRAIRACIGPAPAATLRYARPTDGLEARFSMQHNLAAALVDGAVGFAQLTDAYVRRADLVALYGLTTVETIDDPCPDQPGMARCDRVIIETRAGRRLDSGPVRYPRGHARLPLSAAELDAKFRDCARHGGVADPERLLAALHRLPLAPDMREEVARW